ncbi:hypothetical protein AB0H83_39200 [Dactylosporangium sp. NPDC050688]|uniref:hypothetical protein n=1 Tax=Dactylosporangium sp. NPDC050688 TaxID=3157217 RepID=UPI0033C45299
MVLRHIGYWDGPLAASGLPDDVLTVAACGPAPAVASPDLYTTMIDMSWWLARAVAPAVHLLGCRHHGRTAPWDLPSTGDVWVDRIPPDAVATLARIRTLLGTAWPMSDLRRLLGTQPFLAAAAADPAALCRTLRESAALRPYLFHATAGGLERIWPHED